MKNEFEKQKNEKITVNITGEMTLDEFAEKVKAIVYAPSENNVDVVFFIALLESKCIDADVLIQLANHFNYCINEFKEEYPEWKEYNPKLDSPKDILIDK